MIRDDDCRLVGGKRGSRKGDIRRIRSGEDRLDVQPDSGCNTGRKIIHSRREEVRERQQEGQHSVSQEQADHEGKEQEDASDVASKLVHGYKKVNVAS